MRTGAHPTPAGGGKPAGGVSPDFLTSRQGSPEGAGSRGLRRSSAASAEAHSLSDSTCDMEPPPQSSRDAAADAAAGSLSPGVDEERGEALEAQPAESSAPGEGGEERQPPEAAVEALVVVPQRVPRPAFTPLQMQELEGIFLQDLARRMGVTEAKLQVSKNLKNFNL
nr:skin secretory protein xP2-like [Vicugna pacos]